MATEKESSCQNYCANDPNFAIICSFFDRFAVTCGITHPTFAELQEMIENLQDVPAELVDLHVKLLRKIRRSVATEKWERALIKFCHSYYCSEEGWELERCGYKKCKVSVRLKILKTLLDAQFDLNSKFKNDINKLTAEELRLEPLGRDKVGQSYWCQFDSAANVRVYKEDQDEETWTLVAKDREGLVGLITQLSSGEELLGLELINEDSNSQEVEKPITDTGQVELSTSEENTIDSIATKAENPVKEEDGSTNDNSENNTCSKENVDREITQDEKSPEIKKENDDVKTSQESNECPPSSNEHDKESIAGDASECQNNSLHSEPEDLTQKSSKDNFEVIKTNSPQNREEKPNELVPAKGLDNEIVSDITANNEPQSEQPKVSTEVEEGEIKDVAEEIKLRSLLKSSSCSLFKGKIGKASSGSKLEEIFSRKLEQSNSTYTSDKLTTGDSQITEGDNQGGNKSQDKTFIDDESCSQTSVQSNEQESESPCDERQIKRKPDESLDHPSKRKCLETEPDHELETEAEPEVGEEIEEPVMIIKGEGSGQECDTGNPGKDSEEGVTSENMNNVPSSKSDITLTNVPNENNSEASREIINKDSMNNGITDDNCKENKVLLNSELDEIKDYTDHSEEERSSCNTAKTENSTIISDVKPFCSVKAADEKSERKLGIKIEVEKSIEEQLSDLTGECLSPNSNVECHENNIDSKECGALHLNKNSEKGIRRKSLDSTDYEDNESIPPEAKKTKVQKDCNDIFGTDDSISYPGEENKLLDEMSLQQEKSTNKNDLKNCDIPINENDLSETNLNLKSGSANKNGPNLNIDELKLESKTLTDVPVDDCNGLNESKVVLNNSNLIEETSLTVEKNEGSQEDKEPECLNAEPGTSVNEDNLKSDNNVSCKNEEVNVDIANENDCPEKNITSERKKSESDLDVASKVTTPSPKTRGGKQSSDENDSIPKINENEVLEGSEEKKKKMHSLDEQMSKNAEKTSEENISEVVGQTLNESGDQNEDKSDSPLKDDVNINTSKKKTPVKKSPKPRRKIFTPKSRRRTKNANKAVKPETPEENCLSENDPIKSKNVGSKDKVSDKELETKKDGNNTPKSKETSKTTKIEAKPMPFAGRKRRNSRKNTNTEKESEEDLTSDKKITTEAEEEEIGGKRRKVKGKRTPNKNLRKSVEDKRNCKSSSEEENHPDNNVEKESKKPKESKKAVVSKQKSPAKPTKTTPAKTKANVKTSPKIKKEDTKTNDSKPAESNDKKKKSSKSQGRNSRAFLGIDLDIDLNDTSRSVRQSSRIAQIKIKEQADHKHGEEHRQDLDKPGKKHKKKKEDDEEKLKGTPTKKKKAKKVSDDDVPEEEPSSEKKRRRRKKKHKNPVRAFNERDPWKSSSGSSSDAEEEEEEDHFDDIVEEEEDLPMTLKSDHEFSPESDIEDDEEWKPVRRARTAQKDPAVEAGEDLKDVDDFACEKCGKKDHPEWILLCDTCDHGWHASCLRPSLMLVPEGDWHCPPCQHAQLVKQLQETLKIYDRDTKRRENEELRKKRLAYVGISLDNVLPSNSHLPKEEGESGSESSESSGSGSESKSEYSDEPVYQLRQRRMGTTSYRFNEYDDLINSAIQDEVEVKGVVAETAVASQVVTACKEGEEKPQTSENGIVINGEETQTNSHLEVPPKEKLEKPKKKSKEESDEESSGEYEDNDDEEDEEEFPRVVPKRTVLPRPGRKKHRRLNCLDDASDDDDGSDEDFKGTSSEEEEEEDEEEDDSDESGVGRRRSRRGNLEPVRRSSRARKSRFDKEFINDDSEESDAPRRKKTRKLWTDSDSESDDTTWGRRKKKKSYGSSRGKKFKKSKKFTIEDELSDIESSRVPKKKRQRKIKYGGLDDLAVEELPARRTRGKKINYQEVLGSDSDDDIQKTKSFKKAVIDDDDEFVAEKEEKELSAASSGEEEESEDEEKSSSEEEDQGEEKKEKPLTSPCKEIESNQKNDDKDDIKTLNEKVSTFTASQIAIKVSPPKVLNKDKPFPARRGRPPKAMIAPPPERLVSEDEQYKAVVSKVATVGHNSSDINVVKTVNVSEYPRKFSETKDFVEPPQPVTPVKIPNCSFDPKMVKRNPPIKIRSGVPVNTGGVTSPTLGSPISETPPLFPVKSPNSQQLHSPPERPQFQMQRTLVPIQTSPQQLTTARKSINPSQVNVKTENTAVEEDLDDLEEEDLMDDIEEEEEEDDSEDDILEEGEIPKKVARRMARMEERMQRLEDRKLVKHVEQLKSVKTGAVTIQPVSPGAAQPPTSSVNAPSEQKSIPTTQPTQPLLRVVSPLKLMANPPGPLQSTFMNPGLSPRMPISTPSSARMPMPMRPPQQANMMPIMPSGDSGSRRGRGRGKKQEKQEEIMAGGSVIRGMLQQPQSYPPTHYQQQYPPHPRIPFSPQQRMPRPPFHPGHHPLDPSPSGGGPISVKQEPGAHPQSSPVHIPNKPPTSSTSAPPYHPPHRFESRPPGYPPQGNPRPQYGSYPPPPVSNAGYHYSSYPPPMASREDYPLQQQYSEQFSEQPTAQPTSKSFPEEEGSGEFGGLVSYFSSQREEDIDT